MLWIDKLEKSGRLVLWLALAAAAVIIPISYIRQRASESQMIEAARKDADALRAKIAKAEADANKKPERLTLSSMGSAMRALDSSRALGRLWFTNVSPRAGVVCVTGVATNKAAGASAESLASCKQVEPYASNVELTVQFAGGDLQQTCKDDSCSLSFKEAPSSAESLALK